MKPPVESVRISKHGRDTLIQLKRHTSITQWNILLRFALCRSLREPTVPANPKLPGTGIEPVEWKTFAGPYGDFLAALYYLRANQDGIDTSKMSEVQANFRAHIERGTSCLRHVKSLPGLLAVHLDASNVDL